MKIRDTCGAVLGVASRATGTQHRACLGQLDLSALAGPVTVADDAYSSNRGRSDGCETHSITLIVVRDSKTGPDQKRKRRISLTRCQLTNDRDVITRELDCASLTEIVSFLHSEKSPQSHAPRRAARRTASLCRLHDMMRRLLPQSRPTMHALVAPRRKTLTMLAFQKQLHRQSALFHLTPND